MLHLMRKHAGSWLIKAILGVIVVVFVFWGVGSYRAQKRNRVAVVNGEVIGLDEYRGAYNQLMEQYRKQFGNTLNQTLLKNLNVKKQALDQLINRRLIFQEARKLSLHVTKDELVRSIQGMPAFQDNGHFNARRYHRLLSVNRMTAEAFEESVKNDLLVEKMRGFILRSTKVSDAEAFQVFKWGEEKVNLDYVAFEPSTYEDVNVAPEEVSAYFSNHKKTYEVPPKVKVAYIHFGFKELESQVDIQEEEISQYFELNKETYATPKQVRARHILFRREPDADRKKLGKPPDKVLKVLEEVRSGADFAELAKKYSDDPGSKSKGGDLGFFTKDRMVKPFSDVAFDMKPGEVSEPVSTRFGWHLIKVEEVQEAKDPALDEVEDKIRDKLVKDKVRNLAYDRAEEMYDACYATGHVMDAANTGKVQVIETGFFTRHDRIKGIKEASKFAKVAFDLGDDEVSEPVELGDGYYILEVTDRKSAEIPELETIRGKVRDDLIKVRQEDMAKKDAEEFLATVKEGGIGFRKEAKKHHLEVMSTDFFTRLGSIAGIGPVQKIKDIAFSLSPSKTLPDTVIKGKQGYYVICLKDRREADPKDFETKKSEIKSRLISQKRQKLMDEWFTHLRQKSKISIQEEFLD